MPPNQTKKRRLNLDTVVMEAANLCDDIGIERLSISTLADRLGIRPPSLYNHIKSLDDLYSQLTLRGFKELTAAVENSLAQKSSEGPVLALARATRQFAQEHPTLFLCSTRYLNIPAKDRKEAGGQLMELTLGALSDNNDGTAEVAHYFLRCLIYGFLALEANDALQPATDVDKLFEDVMKFAEDSMIAAHAT